MLIAVIVSVLALLEVSIGALLPTSMLVIAVATVVLPLEGLIMVGLILTAITVIVTRMIILIAELVSVVESAVNLQDSL